MEEQRKKKQQLQEIDESIDDDDDDEEEEEEEDEDFEEEDDDGDDDDDDDFEEDMKEKPTTNKKRTKEQKGHKKRKRDTDDDENFDNNNSNDDDEEEESMEEKRKRLLQQRAEEQVLRVSVERFVIPEVLFRPIDAGLQSDLMGVSHAIVQSVESCPEPYRPALYRSVYLVGGVTLLPNLMERLQRELRSLVPTEYDLKISMADSPIDRAWLGAKSFFGQVPYTKWSVSRQEWENVSKRKAYNKLLIENGGCYV
jgi:actin-related protein